MQQKSTPLLYQLHVRSILNYGSSIYGFALWLHLTFRHPNSHRSLQYQSPIEPMCRLQPPLITLSLTIPSASLLTAILYFPNTAVHQLLFNTSIGHTTHHKVFTFMPALLQQSLSKKIQFHCIPHVFSSNSTWATPNRKNHLKLMELPKPIRLQIPVPKHYLNLSNAVVFNITTSTSFSLS